MSIAFLYKVLFKYKPFFDKKIFTYIYYKKYFFDILFDILFGGRRDAVS